MRFFTRTAIVVITLFASVQCTAPNPNYEGDESYLDAPGDSDASTVDAKDVIDGGGGTSPDLVSDLVSIDMAGGCDPGDQRSIPCGNCGTETQTCTRDKEWSPGACQSEGQCAPGATRPGSCDTCSQQTCGATCQWDTACALKPGNACEVTGDGCEGR